MLVTARHWSFCVALGLAACGEQAGAPPAPPAGVGASSTAGAPSAGGQAAAGTSPAANGSGAVSSIAGASSAGASSAGANGSVSGGANAGQGGASVGAGSSAGAAGSSSSAGTPAFEYPPRAEIVAVLARVNQQFADKWPDPNATLPGNRPSNIWTRAVYYEGSMALYGLTRAPAYRDYALEWADANDWGLRSPSNNADNQCAGQTYLELHRLDGGMQAKQIAAISKAIDAMVASAAVNAWTWVDAIQMSMPVFAQLGALSNQTTYYEKMYALYAHSRDVEGGGLYDTKTHLWWRDAKWKPPAQLSPAGKDVYWSRGNGWVFAALARVLERIPESAPHRALYVDDFVAMANALKAAQRADGFWNPSLADAMHYGGPELTGTALFTFGMAWGIRRGLLDEASYAPSVLAAWRGMLAQSVHEDGFLGFVQSTGDDPSDGQPLSFDKLPDFEDYGVGCFLLAGSALAELSDR